MNATTVSSTTTEKLFDPHAYFETRTGLYVNPTFKERIIPEQKKSMPYRGLDGIKSSILPRNMPDRKIIDEILGGIKETRTHVFTLDQIATIIDLQPNGKHGELLNDGDVNIFYVSINEVLFVISVYWSSCDKWLVDAWYLDEIQNHINVGTRVFRNTILTI
ncbi:MAG: hypothetical protein A2937_00975 [Candidatus Yonathbacteria bacterium RIFCSPLOWO2_01_FULL_47_33b]|uniref:Uncharacterized protein n=1 Tax=Candidatus Yonathbacteria bacterium RIFCSPLOWO2_01_FULL_47_33b TaxID=1802727 RepID=A0A1G2SEM9_9BACT|nr:MAG: hypothetical protein A2937_00975 [Candidatus Yonathbacteria bacterium RIFCSPLOWO2_01_FULL_47_33b]